MFTQKSHSRFTKLGDVATFFLLAVIFVGGGFLFSRHISLAVPLLIFTLMALPMFAMRLMMLHAAHERQKKQAIPVEAPVVEWKQIVGKDGEVVEVGYLKKRRDIG
jgi:hypothetical protein